MHKYSVAFLGNDVFCQCLSTRTKANTKTSTSTSNLKVHTIVGLALIKSMEETLLKVTTGHACMLESIFLVQMQKLCPHR